MNEKLLSRGHLVPYDLSGLVMALALLVERLQQVTPWWHLIPFLRKETFLEKNTSDAIRKSLLFISGRQCII